MKRVELSRGIVSVCIKVTSNNEFVWSNDSNRKTLEFVKKDRKQCSLTDGDDIVSLHV